jgi:hypothetical protein
VKIELKETTLRWSGDWMEGDEVETEIEWNETTLTTLTTFRWRWDGWRRRDRVRIERRSNRDRRQTSM